MRKLLKHFVLPLCVFSLYGQASKPSAPAPPISNEAKRASLSAADAVPTVSQKQLDRTVSKWQKILRLDDWRVRAKLVRLSDLDEGTLGFSEPHLDLRYCSIGVLDPRDYAKAAMAYHTIPLQGREIERDIRNTVVHELVHLRLIDLMMADAPHLGTAEELTVDRLTSALLREKQ